MHRRKNGANSMTMRSNKANNSNYFSNLESGNLSRGETNSNIMEQQNNERIADLSEQVARLKGLTIDIGNEVREQNSLLDNMGDNFGNVGDLLNGTMRRIGTLLDRGGAKHMFYLVGFVVAVMVFLYWVMKHKS
uniref:t-SNARE coiled-coil homology domain-containing protein n=1 Tax=Leptocylindrus danicus TaxID=163516 RepID=A0A7S2NWZ0_9STRA|mmetsp:Transcript_16277/g.23979  ORF Transcript_16277/g.23979 Transcript_16277/m.23979 type:complete len:134 (+) Transcript_16277:231-632(+)